MLHLVQDRHDPRLVGRSGSITHRSKWPVADRARWLQALAMNLPFIHADDPRDGTIQVGVNKSN